MSKRLYGESKAVAAANEILARAAANPTRIRMNRDNSVRLMWSYEEHEISVNVAKDGRTTCTEKFQDQVFYSDVPFEEVADTFYDAVQVSRPNERTAS